MLVELNRVYILSAPKSVQGMSQGDGEFFEFTSNNMMYSFVNKLRSAEKEEITVTGLSKLFTWKDQTMQACIFFTTLPRKDMEKMITEAVAKHQGIK